MDTQGHIMVPPGQELHGNTLRNLGGTGVGIAGKKRKQENRQSGNFSRAAQKQDSTR